MRLILLHIASLLLSIFIACTGNLSEPEMNSDPDTTSHNFVWQYDTIGIWQSYLRDVSIISPDNIWAVGEINTEDTGIPDSTGKIIRAYNAVHWNGSEWELHRLKTARSDGPLGEDPINAVYAFSSNDIWMFAYGGSYLYWDGHKWETEFVWERKGGIYTIWGFSSNDLYFAGTNGSLTHYDGNSFTLVQTGTTLDIEDIWGAKYGDGTSEILCVASNNYTADGREVIKILPNGFEMLNNDNLPFTLTTIWFVPGKSYYVAGDGIYHTSNLGDPWIREESFPPKVKSEIQGINHNDLFVVGASGLFSHWNGATWYHFGGNDLPYFNGSLASVDYKGDLAVAVGFNSWSAIILRGYRQ